MKRYIFFLFYCQGKSSDEDEYRFQQKMTLSIIIGMTDDTIPLFTSKWPAQGYTYFAKNYQNRSTLVNSTKSTTMTIWKNCMARVSPGVGSRILRGRFEYSLNHIGFCNACVANKAWPSSVVQYDTFKQMTIFRDNNSARVSSHKASLSRKRSAEKMVAK